MSDGWFDYHFRVKAVDRVPLRNAFVALGVITWDGSQMNVIGPGAVETVGPIDDWQNPGTPIMSGGAVLHHYNLRLPYDLRQLIIDKAAQGDVTAQTIVANRARFYSKLSNGLDVLADIPKRVWL